MVSRLLWLLVGAVSLLALVVVPGLAAGKCRKAGFRDGAATFYLDRSCMAAHERRHRLSVSRRQRKQAARKRRRARVRNSGKIRTLQKMLVGAGYTVGRADGVMGRQTRKAVEAYSRKHRVRRKGQSVMMAVLAHLKKNRTLPPPSTVAAVKTVFSPSAERGEKYASAECRGCHSFSQTGGHKVGPNLYGISGQLIGSANFQYSESLKFQMMLGTVWDTKELDCYLKNPEGCKPGTTMGFAGIESGEKRADIIAWLEGLGRQ